MSGDYPPTPEFPINELPQQSRELTYAWKDEFERKDAEIARLSQEGVAVSTRLQDAYDENAKLREWIVMADNRLECKDCPQCVDIARSYLQEALNPNELKGESGS